MAVKPLSKPKKVNKSQLKKKCDALASAYYRRLTPYCELAGKDSIHCGGSLQWAHIFTRGILHMRYEPWNNLILCAGHHRWYGIHGIEWTRILEKHFPDRLQAAEASRNEFGKVDYEAWITKFQTKTILSEYGEAFKMLADN